MEARKNNSKSRAPKKKKQSAAHKHLREVAMPTRRRCERRPVALFSFVHNISYFPTHYNPYRRQSCNRSPCNNPRGTCSMLSCSIRAVDKHKHTHIHAPEGGNKWRASMITDRSAKHSPRSAVDRDSEHPNMQLRLLEHSASAESFHFPTSPPSPRGSINGRRTRCQPLKQDLAALFLRYCLRCRSPYPFS